MKKKFKKENYNSCLETCDGISITGFPCVCSCHAEMYKRNSKEEKLEIFNYKENVSTKRN